MVCDGVFQMRSISLFLKSKKNKKRITLLGALDQAILFVYSLLTCEGKVMGKR